MLQFYMCWISLAHFQFFPYPEKRAIVRRSGGPFFAPFHINHGIFTFMCLCVSSRRMILLKEMEADNLLIAPWSRWWWESLCFLYRTQKWKDYFFLLGKARQWGVSCGNSSEMLAGMGLKVHDPG